MALNTVELIPSATSYSPFSLGRVKLCSRPDPNILQDKAHQLFIKTLTQYDKVNDCIEPIINRQIERGDRSLSYPPSMVLGWAVKMDGSTTKRVLSTIRVTLSAVLKLRGPSLMFSHT